MPNSPAEFSLHWWFGAKYVYCIYIYIYKNRNIPKSKAKYSAFANLDCIDFCY